MLLLFNLEGSFQSQETDVVKSNLDVNPYSNLLDYIYLALATPSSCHFPRAPIKHQTSSVYVYMSLLRH